jgi:hypothetical protein
MTPLVVTTISVYNVPGLSDIVSRSGPGSTLDLLLGSSLIWVFDLSSVSLFSVFIRLSAAPQIGSLRPE